MQFLFNTTFLLFFALTTVAQETEIPLIQLQEKIKKAKKNSERIEYMLSLAELQYDFNFTASKQIIDEALTLIGSKKDSLSLKQLAKAYVVKGVIKRREAAYPKAIEYYLKAKEIYENQNDIWHASDVLHNMAMVYRYQKEHAKAIPLYKKSISIKEGLNDIHGIAAGYNMMGVSYRQTKRLDSALICYNKARELFTSIKSTDDVQRVNNNMVGVYLSLKKDQEAISFVLKNISYAKLHHKKYSLSTSYRNASNVYKRIKEYHTSLIYIDSSLQIANKEGFKSLISKGYLRKSFLHSKLENYKEAYNEYRIFNKHSDSIFNIENIKKVQALELNYKFNQEKREIELLTKVEASKKVLYKILFIVTILGGIVIGFLFYLNSKARSRVLKEKLEKEQIQKELLNQKVKVSEEETKRLVADNTMRLEFKQELLDRIRKEIIPESSGKLKSTINSMVSELQLQITTEGKLSGVQSKIEEINKGFDVKLRKLYPTLTKSEREICTLLRLNLSIKEIMIVRNASLDSVKSTRYRIRKKIGLSSGEELEAFIQNLS